MFVILVSGLITVILIIVTNYITQILKQRMLSNQVLSAYECGFDPYNEAYNNAIAKFYLIALLYLIFDLELSFILPIAFLLKIIYNISLYYNLILILIFGFIFERYFNIISLSHYS